MAHGIGQQVGYDLLHAGGVNTDLRQVRRSRELKLDILLAGPQLPLRYLAPQQLRHVGGLTLQLELSRFRQGDVPQIGNQPRQQGSLLFYRAQVLGVGLEHAIQYPVHCPLHHRERRAQLVSDVGDEPPPRFLVLLQADAHGVEGLRQLAKLVLRGGLHPVVQMTLGYAPRPGPEGLQRSRYLPRQHQSQQDGHSHGNEAHQP